MKIQRNTHFLHPMAIECTKRIQQAVIDAHRAPMRLFETGREHDRHAMLIQRGKTRDIMSRHLYNLENDPPLYATALDYVYYVNKWSWNLRDSTISAWYIVFGNMVLDVCPELQWGGQKRKATNYCHFELKESVIIDNIDKYPCVVP